MSQEDYIKEHFNKVDTITAKYVSNESWADGIKDELEEGKIYKVSYISVLRSSTQIMLDDKGTVPPVGFIELVEATVDDEKTSKIRLHTFWNSRSKVANIIWSQWMRNFSTGHRIGQRSMTKSWRSSILKRR